MFQSLSKLKLIFAEKIPFHTESSIAFNYGYGEYGTLDADSKLFRVENVNSNPDGLADQVIATEKAIAEYLSA